jgi:F0F1-type ATP synthase assembly protein I
MAKDPGPSDKKAPKPFNTYLKYSGLAIQLVVTIGVAGWLGYLLDNYLSLKFPVFTLVFTMASFGGSFYLLFRSINNSQ